VRDGLARRNQSCLPHHPKTQQPDDKIVGDAGLFPWAEIFLVNRRHPGIAAGSLCTAAADINGLPVAKFSLGSMEHPSS
jgi:hypothetical protein